MDNSHFESQPCGLNTLEGKYRDMRLGISGNGWGLGRGIKASQDSMPAMHKVEPRYYMCIRRVNLTNINLDNSVQWTPSILPARNTSDFTASFIVHYQPRTSNYNTCVLVLSLNNKPHYPPCDYMLQQVKLGCLQSWSHYSLLFS